MFQGGDATVIMCCGILSVTEYGKDVRWDNATHIDSYGNESKCEEG